MEAIRYKTGDGFTYGRDAKSMEEARGWIYKPIPGLWLLTNENPPRELARPYGGQVKPYKELWLEWFGVKLG